MLYHPLRRTMIGIQTALENFAGHTGPDFLETAPPELKALLDSLELTQLRVAAFLEFLPPVCEATPDDDDFGPVLHSDDVRLAASITVPFALQLDAAFPTESYGPVNFLAEKLAVLLGAIEIYAGWKRYTVGQHTTRWQGFDRLIPVTQPEDIPLLDADTPCLGRLFQNIGHSATKARQGLEFYLSQPVDSV